MNWITPNWNAPKQVKALASTRIGGCSKSPYEGLNLGMHVGDDPILVQSNRDLLQQQTEMPTAPVWLNQTHSTVVLEIAQPTNDVLDADGVITSSPNVVCSAMTADCVLQAFLDYDSKAATAFVPGKQQGKWWANMATLTRLRMAKLGIDQVFDSGLCTYQDPQRFYSYRRDGVTGRQATFIWINEN